MQLSTKHLLGIRDLQPGDIQLILDTATQFKEVLQRPIKKVPTSKGCDDRQSLLREFDADTDLL
jgi:aspartate carbamoyltransferase catalytic subunit